MSDNGNTVIFAPDGTIVGSKASERVELRPGVGEWLRQFADVAEALRLGIHCAKCKADLVGKNSDTDRIMTVTCGCREFVWKNRDYREPTPGTH
jgi:hypothetical protein